MCGISTSSPALMSLRGSLPISAIASFERGTGARVLKRSIAQTAISTAFQSSMARHIPCRLKIIPSQALRRRETRIDRDMVLLINRAQNIRDPALDRGGYNPIGGIEGFLFFAPAIGLGHRSLDRTHLVIDKRSDFHQHCGQRGQSSELAMFPYAKSLPCRNREWPQGRIRECRAPRAKDVGDEAHERNFKRWRHVFVSLKARLPASS